MPQKNSADNGLERSRLLKLSLASLGVVYGDIGTSPLYALRECFAGKHAVLPTEANVLGVLSLIFWALILIISIKYLVIILRADNQGEGGILALMELVLPERGNHRSTILILGLFGAALLYGDGTITPAISVLSAIEGLQIATPIFEPYIVPSTLVILFLLFFLQKQGTGDVGLVFGPVMLVWFLVIGFTGTTSIVKNFTVLAALNPYYGFLFFADNGMVSLFILGAIFLVVTGGEALYADIGHFGRAPVRLSWFTIVLICLLLNYFGQGALLLHNREAAINPFYHLTPDWALYPMVVLATAATIIASQAIISGVFSLTFQSIQLGYLPRLRVLHTSEEEQGQIYMPQVNWLLFLATAGVVLGFRSSGNLAGAYGVAVATTMVITTILGYVAMRKLWNWNRFAAVTVAAFFLIIDLSFFTANMLKVLQGGWYPLILGAMIYLLMSIWRRGQETFESQIQEYIQPVKGFMENLDLRTVKKVPGTAIYLTRSPLSTPPAFIHNINHNKIIHRRIIFIAVGTKNISHVRAEDRITFEKLPRGAYRVLVKYGYMDNPNIRAVLRIIENRHLLKIDMEETTFFLSRDTLVPTKSMGMDRWRDKLFLLMARNADRAVSYYNLPAERVFEIGTQIKL